MLINYSKCKINFFLFSPWKDRKIKSGKLYKNQDRQGILLLPFILQFRPSQYRGHFRKNKICRANQVLEACAYNLPELGYMLGVRCKNAISMEDLVTERVSVELFSPLNSNFCQLDQTQHKKCQSVFLDVLNKTKQNKTISGLKSLESSHAKNEWIPGFIDF